MQYDGSPFVREEITIGGVIGEKIVLRFVKYLHRVGADTALEETTLSQGMSRKIL
jgi:hypothetical protein